MTGIGGISAKAIPNMLTDLEKSKKTQAEAEKATSTLEQRVAKLEKTVKELEKKLKKK